MVAGRAGRSPACVRIRGQRRARAGRALPRTGARQPRRARRSGGRRTPSPGPSSCATRRRSRSATSKQLLRSAPDLGYDADDSRRGAPAGAVHRQPGFRRRRRGISRKARAEVHRASKPTACTPRRECDADDRIAHAERGVEAATTPMRAGSRDRRGAARGLPRASTSPAFTGPLSVRQFKGGQSNPTYLLITPTQRYVLRRKPPGQLLASAHAVDREFKVICALGRAHRRAGAARARAVHGRRRHRHLVLRDGPRRGPHLLGPDVSGRAAGRSGARTRSRICEALARAAPRRARKRRARATTASRRAT